MIAIFWADGLAGQFLFENVNKTPVTANRDVS